MRTLPVQAFNANYSERAASTSAVELFPQSTSLSPVIGRTIWNDSTSVLNIRLGPAEDLTAGKINAQIAAGGYYEVPYGYVGQVTGVWVAANGYARMSDIV